MEKPRRYQEWRTTPAARWRDAFNTFGHLLLSHARDETLKHVDTSAAAKEAASQAATSALYNVLMILEGVVGAEIDERHDIEFSLIARVRERGTDRVVETFELAPDGEESACMGFHSWVDGEFRL